MSTITSGTVLGAGLLYDSDTTGNLVIKTGPSAATAATFHGNAVTTFNGNIHVGNIRLGATDFYGNVSSTGWQRLPGGLIIQWGTDTKTGGDHGVMFPIPFLNAVFSVTSTGTTPGGIFTN